MLNVHNISVSFGGNTLFEEVTFRLNSGDRVGLAGKNGAGKSTLLKVLSGILPPDSGSIALDKDVRVGFLKQDIDTDTGRTVLEEACMAFPQLKKIEQQLSDIHKLLAERDDYDSESYFELISQSDELNHRYELLGGYSYIGETEKILQGLGFKRDEFEKATDTFSGGWRMRIELAKLLLQKNEVLLLDEPTNHLDIESIMWLEQFLKSYRGVVVLVSHDKMFLDTVTNRTIEISMGRIYDFNKTYSQYLILREEIRNQQLQAQKNQEKEIKQTEALIERFRYKASKASFAQSLIKKMEKTTRIVVDREDNNVMKLHFPISVQPGKIIFKIEKLAKKYGNRLIFENLNLTIERGHKYAFVGQNGQGKTTLAKIIVGETAHEGTVTSGHNVQTGYFAQDQSMCLDDTKTLVETMEETAGENSYARIRDLLGAFLFSGDDVDKKVKVLSGGERNRLALCKLLLHPFNVLVLDEPTNHLDINSKNILKQALIKFEGTLIIVSHDRDFLQGLTDKVFEFKNGAIKEYPGAIDFYLEQRDITGLRELEKQNGKNTAKHKTADLKNQRDKTSKKLKNKLNRVENTIDRLEKELATLELQMTDTPENPDYYTNYEQKKKQLDQLMETWEQLQEQLE